MNTPLDKRVPWPFAPMASPASGAPGVPPLAKRTNPARRLTEDEKTRIFELHSQGMNNVAIGKEIGCTDVAVGYALKKRHKAQQQATDAAPPEPVIEMYEDGQVEMVSQIYCYGRIQIGNHRVSVLIDTCNKHEFPGKLVIVDIWGNDLKKISASKSQLIALGEVLIKLKGCP